MLARKLPLGNFLAALPVSGKNFNSVICPVRDNRKKDTKCHEPLGEVASNKV